MLLPTSFVPQLYYTLQRQTYLHTFFFLLRFGLRITTQTLGMHKIVTKCVCSTFSLLKSMFIRAFTKMITAFYHAIRAEMNLSASLNCVHISSAERNRMSCLEDIYFENNLQFTRIQSFTICVNKPKKKSWLATIGGCWEWKWRSKSIFIRMSFGHLHKSDLYVMNSVGSNIDLNWVPY